MAINKKLIHFNERSEFDKRLANNEILDTSIVFIKSSQEIWTHGQVYKCSDPDLSNYVTESELQELLSPIQTELTNKASKADVDAVIEEIRKDELVTASALNDLNQRIITIDETINGRLVNWGYIDSTTEIPINEGLSQILNATYPSDETLNNTVATTKSNVEILNMKY